MSSPVQQKHKHDALRLPSATPHIIVLLLLLYSLYYFSEHLQQDASLHIQTQVGFRDELIQMQRVKNNASPSVRELSIASEIEQKLVSSDSFDVKAYLASIQSAHSQEKFRTSVVFELIVSSLLQRRDFPTIYRLTQQLTLSKRLEYGVQFEHALALSRLNRKGEAVYAYQRLLNTKPGHSAARVNLGRLLLDAKQYDLAAKHLIESIQIVGSSHKDKLYATLAEVYLAQRSCQKAIEAAQKSIEFNPDEARRWRLLAFSFECNHQLKLALEAMTNARKLSSSKALIYEHAKMYIRFLDLRSARKLFSDLSKSSNLKSTTLFDYLILLAVEDKKVKLRKMIRKVESKKFKRRHKKLLEVLKFISLNQCRLAVDTAKPMLKSNRDNQPFYVLLAVCFEALKKTKSALLYWQKVVKGNDWYQFAGLRRLMLNIGIKNDNELFDEFKKWSHQSFHWRVYYKLCQKAYDKKRYQIGVRLFQESDLTKINRPEVMLLRAKYYWQLGQHREALQLLVEVTETAPEYSGAWYRLADYKRKLGSLTEAERLFNKVLAIDEDYSDAKYQLARVEAALKRNSEAKNLLQDFLQAKPNHKRARALLVRVSCEMDQPEQCKNHLISYRRLFGRDEQFKALSANYGESDN